LNRESLKGREIRKGQAKRREPRCVSVSQSYKVRKKKTKTEKKSEQRRENKDSTDPWAPQVK